MGFKEARVKSGKSILDAQKELGVTASTLYNWESGGYMPRADKLKQIAEFYGCTVDELLETDEDNKK